MTPDPTEEQMKPCVVVEVPHADDDTIIRHEWVLLGEPIPDSRIDVAAPASGVVSRDTLGRRNRHAWRRWLRVRCNSFQCPATAIVREDWLLKHIEAETPDDT